MRNSSAVRRRLAAVCVVSLALALSACARKPKEIRLTPIRSTVYGLKRTLVMNAVVSDSKGKEMPGAELKWEADRPKVATIDKNGILTSVGPGRTAVKVTSGELSATSTVEVIDAGTAAVSPSRMTLAGPPGTKGTFRVEVRSSKGVLVPNVRPKWTTSDPKVATVDVSGTVSAVAPGRATITAALGDIAGAADLAVTTRLVMQFDANPKTLILRVGDTQQVTPVARDEAGKEIADPAVEWTSSDPKVARVLDGNVTGLASGTATVRAAAGSRTVEVSVLVN